MTTDADRLCLATGERCGPEAGRCPCWWETKGRPADFEARAQSYIDQRPKCHCSEPHYLPVWHCPVHGDVCVEP